MTGIIGEILSGQARKEMRSRTDHILAIQSQLRDSLTASTRSLKKIIAEGLSDALKAEFKTNMQAVLESEVQLEKAIHEHIQVMKGIMEQVEQQVEKGSDVGLK